MSSTLGGFGGTTKFSKICQHMYTCVPKERERENVYLEKELQMSHLLFSITNNQVLGRSHSDFRRCASVRACMLIHS
jgi:hypothetical protein